MYSLTLIINDWKNLAIGKFVKIQRHYLNEKHWKKIGNKIGYVVPLGYDAVLQTTGLTYI